MSNIEKDIDKTTKLGSELISSEKKEYLPSGILRSFHENEEKEVHLRDYLDVLLRRKWIVIVFLATVVVTVAFASILMTPLYKATAIVQIKKRTPNILTKNVIQSEGSGGIYYETQYKILKSRNLAEKVITKLPPEKVTKSSIQSMFSFISIAEEKGKERAKEEERKNISIGSLMSELEVAPIKKSELVSVSFISQDPEFAATVANTVSDEYIKFSMDRKLAPTHQARGRLEKEIGAMRVKLEKSEERLNEYIAKSQIVFLNKEKDFESLFTQKLSVLSKALDNAVTARISKEAIYKEVKRSGIDYSIVLNNPMIRSLTKEYADLEAQYFNLLNIHKPEYPTMIRLEKQIEKLKSRIEQEEQKIINTLDSDYQIALKKEKFLSSAIEKLRNDVGSYQQRMVQYQILKREVATNRELYHSLLRNLGQVDVSATLSESNIQILDIAEVPWHPYKPQMNRNIGLSLIFGLFGGVFLAFFVDYFDNTIKTDDDIERISRLPLLGMVPISKTDPKELTCADLNDNGPLSEAFRSLCTHIQFSNAARPPKQILITSPLAQDGKTLLSVKTAMSLVSFKKEGIIIDADLRRPNVHNFFNLDNSTGLSSFLSGITDFDGLIKNSSDSRLDVITAGPIPPNPSELLNSARMRDLVDALSAIYNYVIIDSAPVLGLSDTLVLTTFVEGVVLVVKAGKTSKDALIQTKKVLYGVNAKILGVVFNGVDNKTRYGYKYYYSPYTNDKKNAARSRQR